MPPYHLQIHGPRNLHPPLPLSDPQSTISDDKWQHLNYNNSQQRFPQRWVLSLTIFPLHLHVWANLALISSTCLQTTLWWAESWTLTEGDREYSNKDNNLSLHVSKTKKLVINFRKRGIVHAPIINGARLEMVESFKFLVINISSNLSWTNHIDATKTAHQLLYFH